MLLVFTVFADIDELQYIYSNERLGYVGDLITDPVAQPHGFKPTASTYTYDANGNIINDSGKGLSIDYNLLNLPRAVSGTAGNLGFHYAYGGEKILKSGPTEDRHYLGGFEIIESNGDFQTECFNHGEGRVRFRSDDQIWDFHLSDHLGNTVVLFADIDGDGYISPDLSNDSDPDNDEVLQRNLYYPFGMPLDGQWDATTQPRMDYLYNGKELQEELGLDWLAFEFRYYDPAIGRFTGVDPIADRFNWVSSYNYAENSPVAHIDLWGLQRIGFDVRFDIEAKKTLSGEQSPEEFRSFLRAEGKGGVIGAVVTGVGVGTVVAVETIPAAVTWALSNPVTVVNTVRNVGFSVFEALTEQQLALWGGTAIVGGAAIKRIGQYTDDIIEVNIHSLAFWHRVPRGNLSEPFEHIDDLVRKFSTEGFDLSKAPHVIKVNGQYIISDGMHRTAAMFRAGEETIPVKVFNWDDFDDWVKNKFLNTPGLDQVIKQALDVK